MAKFNDLVKSDPVNDSRSLLIQFKAAVENKRKSLLAPLSPKHLLNTFNSSKRDNLHTDTEHHDFHRDYVEVRKISKTPLRSRK